MIIHAGRETHTVRGTMANMESTLCTRGFLRVHRSSIVSVRRIREIQPRFEGDYVIVLHDGTKVRTGRVYREAV